MITFINQPGQFFTIDDKSRYPIDSIFFRFKDGREIWLYRGSHGGVIVSGNGSIQEFPNYPDALRQMAKLIEKDSQ